MNRYSKVIGLTGSMYIKEYEKIKHHANKIREINEETVAKAFKAGNTEVLVVFEETGEELLIDDFSDPSDVKKYLGKNFLK